MLRPFNALHDVLLAFLVRNGEIERRVAVRRMVKVHVPPEPEPEPEHVPKVDPAQLTLVDAEPLASTYSVEYYERLGVPVAAELDRPD